MSYAGGRKLDDLKRGDYVIVKNSIWNGDAHLACNDAVVMSQFAPNFYPSANETSKETAVIILFYQPNKRR